MIGRAVLAAVLSLVAARPSGADTNTITDLGTLGGPTSEAWGVNDSGDVAGFSDIAAATHAFAYSAGVMTDLGTLGGSDSYAFGINNTGDIAGSADLASTNRHAVVWSGGVPTDLGTLGGGNSDAYAINDAGQIAGTSYTTGNLSFRAFRHSGGTMTDLGTLGGSLSGARGINAGGDVVGEADISGYGRHAFFWSAGVMTDLDPLGYFSAALAVDSLGGAVGVEFFQYSPERAVRFAGGTVIDLDTPQAFASYAYGVNDAGLVVGESFRGTEAFRRAFIHNAGLLTDLNRLLPPGSGWNLRAAHAVSNGGHIVGWGNLNGGPKRAFLLTLGAGCGNGLIETGESCDDGNVTAVDGCSTSCAIEMSWQCDGQPSRCRTSDQPIDGAKLVMKRSAQGDKLIFVSKDPTALFPIPGGPNDPTVVGAHVDLFTAGVEWPARFDLPAGSWQTSGSGTGHKFVNPTAPDSTSGVRVAKLGQGTIVRIVAKSLPLELIYSALDQGASIRIRTGSQWNCARFGPATVTRNVTYPNRVFVAREALGSSLADCAESSLQ